MSNSKGRGNTLEICLIIFCIIAFIGITIFFFWRFGSHRNPDSPTGPNDTIVGSTEVKIDLLGSDASSSIVGKSIPFIPPVGQKEILCEPGMTYYTEPFYVKNTGEVKVDYIISISEGTSPEAKAFKEAFTFRLATDTDDKTAPVPLTEYRGVLEAGESTPSFHLVITMKPTAGNQFQGKTFETIGIKVTAMEHGRSGQE